MNILHFILLVCLLSSCEKNIPCPDPDPCIDMPCDTSMLMGKLDTLWTTHIQDDRSIISNEGIFYKEEQVLLVGSTSTNGFVSSFGADTGKKRWEWDEISVSHFSSSFIHDSKMIVQNREDIGSINLMNGLSETIYQLTEHRASNTYGQLLGSHYYFTIRTLDDSKAWIVRSNVNDLNVWETVYTLERGQATGGSRPQIQSYNLWVHPQTKDSILIFQHRMAFPDRVDVVAWNMTKEETVWQHDDLTRLGNSNHQQIFMLQDKAYFGGGTAFYCFDMFSGNIVWEYEHPSGINGFGLYKIIYAEKENSIIVKDAGTSIFAFHPDSGNIKWNTNHGGGGGSPAYHDGFIYFTSFALLYCVQASNGILLWSERSSRIPLGQTSFGGDVAIDTVGRVLYATDDNELFAIKLYND